MDEAELAAGRVQVGEASILWHIEVDIEVDIEASDEGPAVAAWSLLWKLQGLQSTSLARAAAARLTTCR